MSIGNLVRRMRRRPRPPQQQPRRRRQQNVCLFLNLPTCVQGGCIWRAEWRRVVLRRRSWPTNGCVFIGAAVIYRPVARACSLAAYLTRAPVPSSGQSCHCERCSGLAVRLRLLLRHSRRRVQCEPQAHRSLSVQPPAPVSVTASSVRSSKFERKSRPEVSRIARTAGDISSAHGWSPAPR